MLNITHVFCVLLRIRLQKLRLKQCDDLFKHTNDWKKGWNKKKIERESKRGACVNFCHSEEECQRVCCWQINYYTFIQWVTSCYMRPIPYCTVCTSICVTWHYIFTLNTLQSENRHWTLECHIYWANDCT